jgi:hypothetical protein
MGECRRYKYWTSAAIIFILVIFIRALHRGLPRFAPFRACGGRRCWVGRSRAAANQVCDSADCFLSCFVMSGDDKLMFFDNGATRASKVGS